MTSSALFRKINTESIIRIFIIQKAHEIWIGIHCRDLKKYQAYTNYKHILHCCSSTLLIAKNVHLPCSIFIFKSIGFRLFLLIPCYLVRKIHDDSKNYEETYTSHDERKLLNLNHCKDQCIHHNEQHTNQYCISI